MADIAAQYQNADNLNIRIAIHSRYSVNTGSFFDWVAAHYAFAPGDRVLELGCGTAELWKTNLHLLEPGVHLTLTDLSSGMVATAKGNLPPRPDIAYGIADIQNIPYPDESFDAVIANMMLYHVPDLHRGLSEVYRVLKPGGRFYCATNGENGVHSFTTELMGELGIENHIIRSFTLQNGAASLARHFSSVTRHDRQDGLKITKLSDYADYVYSFRALTQVAEIPRQQLMAVIEKRAEDGVLYIPKETGIFVCQK